MSTYTVIYDDDGNETDDRSKAVRGEVVERDERGRIVRRYPDLTWQTDDRALAGDPGEAATRPRRES
jgi:hypothetical protein